MTGFRLAALGLGLLVLAAGCGNESDGGDEPAVSTAADVSTTTPDASEYRPVAKTVAWEDEVRLVPVDYDEWVAELEAFEGEVVVVDYWATWCVPCRERFPHMVAMSEEYGDRGVQFVSVSLDDRDDPVTIDEVTRFLESQDARMPNYLMDEIIPDAFDKLDLLGIPAVAVFNRDGSLYRKLTGDNPNDQFTEADVEQAVLELIE